MQKMTSKFKMWLVEINRRWQKLSLAKQRKYMLLVFGVYLLLYGFVLAGLWFDLSHTTKQIPIKHIENPIKKSVRKVEEITDSILKNKAIKKYEYKE